MYGKKMKWNIKIIMYKSTAIGGILGSFIPILKWPVTYINKEVLSGTWERASLVVHRLWNASPRRRLWSPFPVLKRMPKTIVY